MELYAKGKRSFVYKIGNTVRKVERSDSDAICRMENEAHWLKILNAYCIGPRLLESAEASVSMEFVDGVPILEWAATASIAVKRAVLLDLLRQCRVMDTLGVTKEEMHHPLKHVLVRDGGVVLIDFERCHSTEKPKNVTQVCQFIDRYFHCPEIVVKARTYKESYSEESYQEVVQCLTSIS